MNSKSILSISNLKMKFGDNEVLKGINLEVGKGDIIGYIGPNGAGKSTTIKILLGLLEGFTGEVKIFGESIVNQISYKKRIGYVPESSDIYDNLSAQEYLTFIGELYGLEHDQVNKKAKSLMKILGIEDVYESRISSFSKGMKQKVLIISSLLHNPDILFWDEPLSGLDANSVIVVKEILSTLSLRGKTIFYSSHIMEVVEKISNRILLISDGLILADGSFEQLRDKSEGSLEEIFNQLTGFNEHQSLASDFVDIIETGDSI
ncbi:ATP-binding cassette domain-containing protein [Alkalibaculum sp. M08DMB]|uniref:ATP-binding cassette domain-containing protein n=1 Tax=Alkalibaculum sporogenes TaxID=2655001 RepID=A0A6A7K9P1_9FIRM|nr:ABC transporter ATP-binding protein [Alkalibaculum sporogenes]MPW26102.1 ATP-binding cassette domain-containing protein [Alkalibaculum sporogenes]